MWKYTGIMQLSVSGKIADIRNARASFEINGSDSDLKIIKQSIEINLHLYIRFVDCEKVIEAILRKIKAIFGNYLGLNGSHKRS